MNHQARRRVVRIDRLEGVGVVVGLEDLHATVLRQARSSAGEGVAAIDDLAQAVGVPDAVLGGAAVEVVGVEATTAVELVAIRQAGLDKEPVVAIVAEDEVAVRATVDDIVAGAAFDDLSARFAIDDVVAVAPEQELVGRVGARQPGVGRVALDDVAAGAAEHDVLLVVGA